MRAVGIVEIRSSITWAGTSYHSPKSLTWVIHSSWVFDPVIQEQLLTPLFRWGNWDPKRQPASRKQCSLTPEPVLAATVKLPFIMTWYGHQINTPWKHAVCSRTLWYTSRGKMGKNKCVTGLLASGNSRLKLACKTGHSTQYLTNWVRPSLLWKIRRGDLQKWCLFTGQPVGKCVSPECLGPALQERSCGEVGCSPVRILLEGKIFPKFSIQGLIMKGRLSFTWWGFC